MSVMLGDMAVTAVVKYLNNQGMVSRNKDSVTGHCKALKAYKYEKPSTVKGEYIVVNHLPFYHRDVVCEGVVNINIHVPKLKNGLPDIGRLAEIMEEVVELFPEGTYLEKAYYDFLTDSRPTPDNDDTYYVNIQISVTFNNLNN